MSDFLPLPESSPAEPLMNAIVHLGDTLADHWDLLPEAQAKAMFGELCRAAHHLYRQAQVGRVEAILAMESASRDDLD